MTITDKIAHISTKMHERYLLKYECTSKNNMGDTTNSHRKAKLHQKLKSLISVEVQEITSFIDRNTTPETDMRIRKNKLEETLV